MANRFGPDFPAGTLLVNVTDSLILTNHDWSALTLPCTFTWAAPITMIAT